MFDDEVVDNVQSETGATLPAPGCIERIENAVKYGSVDTFAVVAHQQLDHVAIHDCGEGNFAGLTGIKGVLQAVQGQVGDNLGQCPRITVEHDVRRARQHQGDRHFFQLGLKT